MLQVIKSQERHFLDMGWLQTHWLFSFGDYYDPENISHGTLRVFNDDVVQPRQGFSTHPHKEMEIISIVLQGEMVHKDTMGNEALIKKGDVQRMSAGTGLYHSEWNDSDDVVAFLQIWILPDQKGLTPSYDQKHFDEDFWKDRLALLASGDHEENAVRLNTDALLFRASIGARKSEKYSVLPDRALFLYVIDGELSVNGVEAGERDQVRISAEKHLEIESSVGVDFVLVDVPEESL